MQNPLLLKLFNTLAYKPNFSSVNRVPVIIVAPKYCDCLKRGSELKAEKLYLSSVYSDSQLFGLLRGEIKEEEKMIFLPLKGENMTILKIEGITLL